MATGPRPKAAALARGWLQAGETDPEYRALNSTLTHLTQTLFSLLPRQGEILCSRSREEAQRRSFLEAAAEGRTRAGAEGDLTHAFPAHSKSPTQI